MRRGRGGWGRPNKYLTKSSGKLIPSLGRLLRGGGKGVRRARRYLQTQRRRRARASETTAFRYRSVRAIFLVRSPRADRRRAGITSRRETMTSAENTGTAEISRQPPGFPSVSLVHLVALKFAAGLTRRTYHVFVRERVS